MPDVPLEPPDDDPDPPEEVLPPLEVVVGDPEDEGAVVLVVVLTGLPVFETHPAKATTTRPRQCRMILFPPSGSTGIDGDDTSPLAAGREVAGEWHWWSAAPNIEAMDVGAKGPVGPSVRAWPGLPDRLGGIDLTPLWTLLTRIEEHYRPRQVWLFGSRARGEARPESDWDLLVVLPDSATDQDLDPVAAWRLQRGSGVFADVIPYRLGEFLEDRETVNTLPYIVAREGLLLHER